MCGDLAVFKHLLGYGCPLSTLGFILHDRHNLYKTSVLGIAVAYGRKEIVKYILGKVGKEEIDFKCVKTPIKFETLTKT